MSVEYDNLNTRHLNFRTVIFLCMLFLSFTSAYAGKAQSSGVVNPPPLDTLAEKARKLWQIADTLLDKMQYRAAEKLLLEAHELASKAGEKKLTARIDNYLAECYSMTGRTDLAVSTYEEAIKIMESLHDTNGIAVLLINLGDEYAKTGRTRLAAETELKAIRLKEDIKDYRKLAFYYQKLGELFSDNDHERWEYYIMKALALSRTPEYTTIRATLAIYNDLGAIWRLKGDYILAAAYYDTLYNLSMEADYPKGIITANSERALMHYEQGEYEEALKLSEIAYRTALDCDDEYKIVYEQTLTARILMKLGQTDKAIPMLVSAAQRAKHAELKKEEYEAYKYLSEAYRSQSKWEAALEVQDKFMALKDSINNTEVQHALNELQTRFETEKKQQLIDNLNIQNIAHQKRNRLLIGLLLTSGILLVLLVLIIRLRNRTIKQGKKLLWSQHEINRLEKERMKLDLESRSRELTASTLHLISKNKILNDIKTTLIATESQQPALRNAIAHINQNLNLDQDWPNFSRHFEDVHPDFFRKLKSRFPELTAHEERLCAYLTLNLNTKEISQILNVTTAAVDKSRNRLRKKLNIGPETNLNDFLSSVFTSDTIANI